MYTVERSSHTEILPRYFGSHRTLPAIRRLGESRGVVNQGIGPPHERHAIDLSLDAHQRQGSELRRELAVAGNLREIERQRQACRRDRGRNVARRRDHVVISGAAAAQLGHQFIARSHVGGGNFAVILLFEATHERWIGVAFPHQQVQRGRFLAQEPSRRTAIRAKCQNASVASITLPPRWPAARSGD